MNSNYPQVALTLCALWFGTLNPAASTPLFLDCNQDTITLCVSDPGVRLPANNQSNLGEGNPDATSCSVHISRQTTVQVSCPGELTYEVVLYLFESSDPIVLQSTSTTTPDSQLMVTLSFDSEFSPDSMVRKNGIPYTTGCARYHRVVWTVTDACGESSECEMWMDVYDCLEPVHFLNTLQFITFPGGFAQINLTEFVIHSLDDCTSSGDYLYSFIPDAYIPDSLFEICQFKLWGIEILHPIWIADEGRDLNCDGIIEWNERNIKEHNVYIVNVDGGHSDCFDEACYLYAEIKDRTGSGIKNVVVSVSTLIDTVQYLTDSTGKIFKLPYMSPFWIVEPSKTDFHKNGVNTLDNVKIQKHLLGIEPFISPYQFIAADVSSSSGVTAIDLIINRKMILGLIDEYPGGQSWKFFRDDYEFPVMPGQWTGHPGQDTFFQCITHSSTFIGIKLGDLNNTAKPNALSLTSRNSDPVVFWTTEQKKFSKGEEFEIPVYSNELQSLLGFQLTLSSPDLEFLDVYSDHLDLQESFALFGNHLTMAWADIESHMVHPQEALFTIRARALKNGILKESLSLNSDITEAQVYSGEEETFIPLLKVLDPHEDFIFSPNPWKEFTNLNCTLPEDGIVKLDIMNVDGRLVYSTSNHFPKGSYQIKIKSEDLPGQGIFFYKIKTGDHLSTGKMIKVNQD